jgi:S1-C subfamily serine protease
MDMKNTRKGRGSMKVLGTLVSVLVLTCVSMPAVAADTTIKDAVVKIYTVSNSWDYAEPWQMSGQESCSGSGCIIANERILTNAHVVENQTFMQVRKTGDPKKYTARLEKVAHECDLALLRVEDKSFFGGIVPVEIGELAQLKDAVAVYGFPIGGDKLCITEGVVSRVEHSTYLQSHARLLTCQIDAAINPGSSGGPVIKDGKLVGVAFQGLCADNIGYMVPPPVIRHFLDDIADGTYDGIPGLGVLYQEMENPDLRYELGMNEVQAGVLVTRVYPGSPATGILKPGDVVLSVDGIAVANDGTIELREGEWTSCEYVIQRKHINDTVRLTVLREGSVVSVEIRLTKPVNAERLVPHEQYDVAPTYYILGGLVFQPLTRNYLETWGRTWWEDAPSNLLSYYRYGQSTEERREIVLLTKVLADESNVGYHDLRNRVITSVNGRNIATMRDLVKAVEGNDGKYYVIVDEQGYTIVLDRAKVEERAAGILKTYRVGAGRSEDLERLITLSSARPAQGD